MDSHETWYLETASGHRWLACRIPEDQYFVTGNQSRFRRYDPHDTEHYLASADLIEHAIQHGLYDPAKGDFDFHEAYIRDVALDTTYNYPRVWGLQAMLSPSIPNDVMCNTFPVFARADHQLGMEDLRRVFRFHYQGTEHDPYLHANPGHRTYKLCRPWDGRPRGLPTPLSGDHILSRGLHQGNEPLQPRLGLLEVPQGAGARHGELQPLCPPDPGDLCPLRG